MNLDLTRPEHRERLAHCCHAVLVGEMYSTHALRTMPSLDRACFEALSSPSDSAAIVRALLEGCGVTSHEHHEEDWDGECDAEIVLRVEDGALGWADYHDRWELSERMTVALILRLLACTTREEALAARMEVGG